MDSPSSRSSRDQELIDGGHLVVSLTTPAPPPSAGLVLVPDDESPPNSPYFEFSDEDDEEDPDDLYPPLDRLRASAIPPLPHSLVFLYMLAPCAKLGAFLVPAGDLPLKIGIPALIFFSILSGFARQIWYMLARYVGKADVEDVLLDTFARGRGREEARAYLRFAVRIATGAFRILLATMYLRESADAIFSLHPLPDLKLPHWLVVILLALFITPLIRSGTSFASKSIIYTTWFSLVLYVAWVICALYGQAKGTLVTSPTLEDRGVLWDSLSVVAFSFATLWDVPLYAALKAGKQSIPRTSGRRSRTFRIVSVLAMGVSIALVIPLAFLAPSRVTSVVSQEAADVNGAMAALRAGTLLFTIPLFIITTPPIPLPSALRRDTQIPVSRIVTFFLVLSLAMVPTGVTMFLNDITLLLALAGTFFLPALLHIVIHTFKRPLSILIPRRGEPGRPSVDDPERAPLAATDELLQRKERALQRRRLWRRIAWDVGVWVLLLPVGGGGFIWALGRLGELW